MSAPSASPRVLPPHVDAPPRLHTTWRLVPAQRWRDRPDTRWTERAALWAQLDRELRAAGRRPAGPVGDLHVAAVEHGVRLEISVLTVACPPAFAGLPADSRSTAVA